VASAPATSAAVASASAVKVSWSAPTFLGGNPITSWSVTASNGRAWNLPTATRSLTVGGLNALAPVSFRVAALTADGAGVPGTTAVVNPTTASLASSAAKVKKKKPFLLTARVLRRGSSAAAPGVAVLLQRKAGSSWVNISSGTTGRAGTKAWTLRQSKSTYYRVVTRPGGLWFGSTSTAKLVKKR
jgi:5-hydroxyisourate hydrolase-like protein (transthyretin family)